MAAVRPAFEAVGRPGGTCDLTGEPIEPGTPFFAALREDEGGLERIDVTPAAWEGVDKVPLIAYWRTTMPAAGDKPKPIVDDATLGDLVERLADAEAPEQQRFRFVVALVLMRKRQLTYEATEADGDAEHWIMRWRGRQHSHRPDVRLLDPKLDESQIADLTQSVGQILNAEVP